MSTENTPDLKLRAEVAKIDGWVHIVSTPSMQWNAYRKGDKEVYFYQLPKYELDRNAIVEAIQRWAGDDTNKHKAFMEALNKRLDMLGKDWDALGWATSLFTMLLIPPRELCLALVAADKATKGGEG